MGLSVHLRKFNQEHIPNIEGLSFENLPDCSVCLSPIIRQTLYSAKYFYQHTNGEEHPLHEECLIYMLKNRFIKVLKCPICHKTYIEDETTEQLLKKVENDPSGIHNENMQIDIQPENRSLVDKITIIKNLLAEKPLHKTICKISTVASFVTIALLKFVKIWSSSGSSLQNWINILYPPALSSIAQIISQAWIIYMYHQHSSKVRYIVQATTAAALFAIEVSLAVLL